MENKPYILIIEDDPFLAEIYIMKIEAAGFKVRIAQDGEAGLALIKEEKPDLMLLDVVLPKVDGFEILRILKKDESRKDVPVILLTNLGQKEDIELGMRLGAVSYLVKAHFTPSEVVEKIREVLNANQMRTRNAK